MRLLSIASAACGAALLTLTACGGGSGGDDSKRGPLYTSQRYSDSQIRSYTDIVFSKRPNEGGQYTDDETKSQELSAPELSLRLDVHVPPGADKSTRRPLLLWIHGGGLVEGSKAV